MPTVPVWDTMCKLVNPLCPRKVIYERWLSNIRLNKTGQSYLCTLRKTLPYVFFSEYFYLKYGPKFKTNIRITEDLKIWLFFHTL